MRRFAEDEQNRTAGDGDRFLASVRRCREARFSHLCVTVASIGPTQLHTVRTSLQSKGLLQSANAYIKRISIQTLRL
jgi:hypothetical protein